MAQRLADQVLRRLDGFVCGHFHGRSGNHFRPCENLVAQGAAERVLHEQLLELQVGSRNCQSLLVLGDGALCPDDFDRRQAADLHLFLGVGQRLLRKCQGFLLHANIFVSVNQIPIHRLNLIHRRNDLQAESHIRKFTVVLGDAEETGVGGEAKSLEQMLSELSLEARIQLRAKTLKEAIGRSPRVVESYRQVCSPAKGLLVGKVDRTRCSEPD